MDLPIPKSPLKTSPLNITYDELLELEWDEFKEWCDELKSEILEIWDNQNIPPSSIFSSNIYYSKKSGKVITLLYSNSIATQGEYNHYMYGGGKYLFIPENKELVSEKIKTNKMIGWGFVLLTTLKLFIL